MQCMLTPPRTLYASESIPDVLAFNFIFSERSWIEFTAKPETYFNCCRQTSTNQKKKRKQKQACGKFKMLLFNSILAFGRKRHSSRKLSHINTLARTMAMATTPLVFDKDISYTLAHPTHQHTRKHGHIETAIWRTDLPSPTSVHGGQVEGYTVCVRMDECICDACKHKSVVRTRRRTSPGRRLPCALLISVPAAFYAPIISLSNSIRYFELSLPCGSHANGCCWQC